MNETKVMNRAADNIRILAVSMVEKANSGHPGGAMGGADFINVLFSEYMVYDPDDATWTGRDRFFLDPGHMSPMLYSALALQGKFTIDELKQFRQWDSPTPGHPERDICRGIENTSGPLGQGHTFAAGAAVAEKFLEARLGKTVMQHKIYAYISDGGIEEEISQGAGRLAGLLGLNNLIMFYDSNDIQLSTECKVVMQEDTKAKYEAWGWNVILSMEMMSTKFAMHLTWPILSNIARLLLSAKPLWVKAPSKKMAQVMKIRLRLMARPLAGMLTAIR